MNLALIGFGYWGPNYARLINEMDELNLKWIVDKVPQKQKVISSRYPRTKFTTNIEDVLHDKETEAVIICTPPTTHFDLSQKCLKYHKHILVEKPLTTSLTQVKKLKQLANKLKLILMVGHTFIYNPAVRYIRKYIQSGKLGKIFYAYSVRTNLGPIRKDVDAFWDIGAHDISTMYYLFDQKPTFISAQGGCFIQPHLIDVGFANIKLTNGILIHIHVSWLDPVKVRKLVIVGSKKMLIYDDMSSEEKVKIISKGVTIKTNSTITNMTQFQAQISLMSGSIFIPKIASSEPLKNQMMAFVKAIKNRKSPESDINHGLKVVATLEQISRVLKS